MRVKRRDTILDELVLEFLGHRANLVFSTGVIRHFLLGVAAPTDGTALNVAAFFGLEKTFLTLLREGYNVNAEDSCGWAALHVAAGTEHENILGQLLLEKGSNFKAKGRCGEIALHCAADAGRELSVRRLSKWSSEITYEGDTVIFITRDAARRGYTKVVQMLLSHTGDLKIKNDCTFAGLQQAAVVAKEAVVKMIPEGYVDPEVRCRYAAALLRKAASNPHTSALQLLLEHAHLAKASDKCTGIQNVLWAAASVNNEAATRLLLDAGADPNHQADKRKDPVMHCSIRNRRRRFGSLGVVEMLKIREATVQTRLEHGDSTEVPRNTTLYHHRGCTLLIVTACEDSCRRILQLLLDNGPNREANDTEGKTALYYAAGFGAIAHVRLLLERGAYPTSVNLATIELRREVDQDDYDEGIRLIRDARLEKKAESYTESEMENQVMEGQTESTEVVCEQNTTILA